MFDSVDLECSLLGCCVLAKVLVKMGEGHIINVCPVKMGTCLMYLQRKNGEGTTLDYCHNWV